MYVAPFQRQLFGLRRERWSGEERHRRELEFDDFQHKFPLLELQEFPRLAQHGPSRITNHSRSRVGKLFVWRRLKIVYNCEQNGKLLHYFYKLKTVGAPKKIITLFFCWEI